MIVEVYDSRYTGIKFPEFGSWETAFEDNVVDYVPAFELSNNRNNP